MSSLTRHGVKRVRQRMGIPKRAAKREIARVLKEGLRHEDAAGIMRKYMDDLYEKTVLKGKDPEIIVYGHNAYIFSWYEGDLILITTFPIPVRIRRMITKKSGEKTKKLREKIVEEEYENETAEASEARQTFGLLENMAHC